MSKLIEVNRGYDRKSINRHSWREYEVENYPHNFVIEKCTDASPAYFEAYMVYSLTGRIIEHIKINNSNYWADGKSWKKAIEFFETEYIDKLDYTGFFTMTDENKYDCEYCG